jgi:hypothetical protein
MLVSALMDAGWRFVAHMNWLSLIRRAEKRFGSTALAIHHPSGVRQAFTAKANVFRRYKKLTIVVV